MSAHIYLLQSRRVQFVRCPDWLGHDGETFHVIVPEPEFSRRPTGLPGFDEDGCFLDYDAFERFMMDYSADGDGAPCAIEKWETEFAFAARKEAEEWGHAKSYRYPDGWRVVPVQAAGSLCGALKAQDPPSGAISGNRALSEGDA